MWLAPLAVGLALRVVVWRVERPLWLDEAITAAVALAPPPLGDAALARWDLHPRLFASTLGALFDTTPRPSPLWLRLPSLLASAAAIPVIATAAAPFGLPVARAAAWSMALAAPALMYGAEARPYAFALLGAAGALAAITRDRPTLAVAATAWSLTSTWTGWLMAAAQWTVASRRLRAGILLGALAAAWEAWQILPLQLAAQRVDLRAGHLAPWVADGVAPLDLARLARLPVDAVAALGWGVGASGGARAIGFGAGAACLLAVSAMRRSRREPGASTPDAASAIQRPQVDPGASTPAAASAIGRSPRETGASTPSPGQPVPLAPAVDPQLPARVLLAQLAALAIASAAGWHPLGPTRHAIGLLPALVLALAIAAPRAAVVGSALGAAAWLARGPRLPTEDVAAAIDAVPAGIPLHVDASALPQALWSRPDHPDLARWTSDQADPADFDAADFAWRAPVAPAPDGGPRAVVTVRRGLGDPRYAEVLAVWRDAGWRATAIVRPDGVVTLELRPAPPDP